MKYLINFSKKYSEKKILIDENIPYATKLFNRLGKVKTFSGRSITKEELGNADALIVRSITTINEKLLSGTSIKFVGTATAGIDHVDHVWLKQAGIKFCFARGCNAIAVVEYIFSALLTLAERDGYLLKDRIVGIIGVGNIGGRLQRYLEILGIPTLLCDPLHLIKNKNNNYYSLDQLIQQVDILTLHTPLLKGGCHNTYHLIDNSLINLLKPTSVLINTCRGEVLDNIALLSCLKKGQDIKVVLDVWESESNLNVSLLKKVKIGTAHIAGYTLEGKIRGIIQLFEAYSNFIGKPQKVALNTLLPKPEFSYIALHGPFKESILKRLVHLVYDVRRDDSLLRQIAGQSNEFDKLRKNYVKRREWSSLCVKCDDINTATVLHKLGFNTAIY